jgi:hypothetical protein
MVWIGKYKLSDAILRLPLPSRKKREKPVPFHEVIAEQTREAAERQEARNNEASIRDRMVDIGRGNQQAGRQGP